MKKYAFLSLLFFVILSSGPSVYAQTTFKNSFVIHGASLSQSQKDFYVKSIEAADFEQFRLQTETVVLKFKNGFNLELMPAKDLVIKNIAPVIDINKYSNHASTPGYKYPTFEILSSGWVTAEVQPNSKTNK
ncbi:MAG: hypothetical protein H0W61_15095 [Bacteroidetes bacterium]|nr:hypothetical protein [Bacteroidota bacterium]